jgi:hypothetical protein
MVNHQSFTKLGIHTQLDPTETDQKEFNKQIKTAKGYRYEPYPPAPEI